MKIFDRHTGEAIYEDDSPTVKETVENAAKAGVRLKFAYLERADLRGAELSGADLRCADLESANLRGVDLERADLRGAWLRGAMLEGAKGIVSIGPVGRTGRIIYAVRHGGAVYVNAGCFWGTLDEFACAVIARYGESRDEYDAAIRLIQAKSS